MIALYTLKLVLVDLGRSCPRCMISVYTRKLVLVVSTDVSMMLKVYDLSVRSEASVGSQHRCVGRAQGIWSLCTHGSLCG